jgi:hypothetical protein
MGLEINNFSDDYLLLVNKMTDNVHQLILQGQSKEQIIQLLSSTNMKKTILSDPEFAGSFNNLNKEYIATLKKMDKFADISPSTLQAITSVNQAQFMNQLADDISRAVSKNLTTGVLGGLTKDQMIAGITNDLRVDQIETLMTTALSTYTASIHSLMADKLPVSTSYVYVGPVDKKTRKTCLDFMSQGPLTRKEIEERLGSSVFVERGGYNCRHQWRPYVTNVQMHEPKLATKIFKAKYGGA